MTAARHLCKFCPVSVPEKLAATLPSKRLNAERLNNLMKRLENNEALKQMYHDQMLNYIMRGQVEAAPMEDSTTTVFHLPHQAVKKEKHGKTKWRIVFDTSSHETNVPSLNEVVEMGPNLLPEFFCDSSKIQSASHSHHQRYYTGVPSIGPRRKGERPDQIFLVQNYAGYWRTLPYDG